MLLRAVDVLTVGKACLSFEREPTVVPYPDNDISTTSLIKAAFDSYKDDEVRCQTLTLTPYSTILQQRLP